MKLNKLLWAALRGVLEKLLGEVAVQPEVRREINDGLNTIRDLLDSDGDGVPDHQDTAPFDPNIRDHVHALVDARLTELFSAPVDQGPGVGSPPSAFASRTAPAIDRVASVTRSSDPATVTQDAGVAGDNAKQDAV